MRLKVAADKKITNINNRKPQFNIGILIFGLILAYTLYFVIVFFTTDHVTAYEVESGSIVQDTSYTALALRKEQVYYAADSGIVNYYANEGDRISVRSLIYSLDSNGTINTLLDSSSGDATEYLTSDNLKEISSSAKEFAMSYSDTSFYKLYDFTQSVNSTLNEFMNYNALNSLSESSSDGLSLYYGQAPGIICYYTDGYESLTTDVVTADELDASAYTPIKLENNINVESGYPVYKLVTSEKWSIVVPVSDDVATQLEENGSVEVTFESDNNTAIGTVKIKDNDTGKLAIISFTNSMERYCTKRYLNVKLTLDSVTGLKIPNSAIKTKSFNIIPKEYATVTDSNTIGFFTMSSASDTSTTVTSPTIYYETDDYYYISNDDLPTGTIIAKPDSTDRYVVKDTAELTGVYNINKGYAVFTQIEVLIENSDYSIVKSGTNYGLSQFDYIALNADSISDGEIVK